ncbi:LysR family transcriptional regulator [Burkholderia cenocepacia]|uniref:LysR substrate-binding domain-containing protein n=1 Tax=Burkholderia cenocepacia TaxID=95486 RepID=UPI00196B86CA|nr:LysR substrate-binding domain-containing protein [Burkholderia cenocepacia]MBN3534268.1 LysR family transcriptional regulator [Burkholderia cenocepacia]MBR8030214.1 LysR family transcriptional regulator [Burkholderia cenocepacia]MBR8174081.1 LysR family transcriptional regulator [Burkholderia cenocepacia]MBR8428956.1 LysR family transcriptional regulator [Burkholderia cenocepacia]MBU9659969.1 LysR family transcriptional regulator [Burkholderia cenocepacia]
MPLPSLHAFRVFEAVARLGHVGAAAAELHVTPGAVSQQVRSLQKELGVELFQKRGRKLALTDSGALLQRSVANSIDGIREGVRQVTLQRFRDSIAHEMTISIPETHGIAWLAPRLFAFMDDNPQIKLNILTASVFENVAWRKVDVAIVYGTPPWPGFWWRQLHGIHMTPVCSPQLLRDRHPIRHPSDLAHHRLLHEDDGSQWRRWLLDARVAYSENSNMYFDNFGIVMQAARDGFGVALSDEIVSARDLDDGLLVQPFSLTVPALHNYYCICNEDGREQYETEYLIDWLIEQASLGPASRRAVIAERRS